MTVNPFEKHGIDHLSPGSLRLFKECLPVWIGKYMLRAPDEAGPAAWRGLSVEAGVDRLLFGYDGTVALAATKDKWDTLAQGQIDPDCVKEYEALPDFLVQAGVAYGGKPVPLQRQARITLDVPSLPVPLVGFCDYLWPDHGDDLKTTWRMPSSPDPAHVEQMSCYSMFHGVPFNLTYVTPKKWTRYEITPGMAAEAWDRVVEAAHAVGSFLAHVNDAYDALSMLSPDYTSYYFRPAMAEAVRAAKAARVTPGEPRKPTLELV